MTSDTSKYVIEQWKYECYMNTVINNLSVKNRLLNLGMMNEYFVYNIYKLYNLYNFKVNRIVTLIFTWRITNDAIFEYYYQITLIRMSQIR